MIRFGVDLGGTKIEIVALDARGAEVLRRRVATPAGDYRAVIDAVARLVADAERELGITRDGRHRHAGLDLARDRPAPRLEFRLPQRAADQARPRDGACARGPDQQRRELFRAVGSDRWLGRRRRRGLRRDSRHRRRRRHRRSRARVRRSQCDRRRVGPQSAAVAARRRAARPRLFLRPLRLHRDVRLRSRYSNAITCTAAASR